MKLGQGTLHVTVRLSTLVCFACFACSGNGGTTDASMTDAGHPIADAAIPQDGVTSLSWVDFAVTGCSFVPVLPEPDADAGPVGAVDAGVDGGVGTYICVGNAPLELHFAAIAPTAIEAFLWSFGDGDTADMANPTHVYTQPGVYTVALTAGGPRGTAQMEKTSLIEVRPGSMGAKCTQSSQCEPGLSCLCGEGSLCPVGLESGRCLAECSVDIPCAMCVCADLAKGAPPDPAPWQRALCLPACDGDPDCPDGFTCQELVTPNGDWVHGCFAPGLLGRIGESCLDIDGQPEHSACASGYCASVGARGMCAAMCASGTCPESSACATFTSPQQESLCVARCLDASESCTNDPWLACEPPGAPGDFGFSVDEVAAEPGYCAPRVCSDASQCGPDGTCTNGFCGP